MWPYMQVWAQIYLKLDQIYINQEVLSVAYVPG